MFSRLFHHTTLLAKILRQTILMYVSILLLTSFVITDLYFLGKLGEHALTAAAYVFPFIILVLNIFIGLNSGITATLSLYAHSDRQKFERMSVGGMGLSVAVGLIIGSCLLLFQEWLFVVWQVNNDVYTTTQAYIKALPYSIVLLSVFIGITAIFRAKIQLLPLTIAVIVIVGVALLSEPFLIWGMHTYKGMGIAGASWALLIGLSVGCSVLFVFFVKNIQLPKQWWRHLTDGWRDMLYIALPLVGTRVIMPLAISIVVAWASMHGNAVVAAFGIITRIENMVFVFIIALSATTMPMVGNSLGMGDKKMVRAIIFKTLLINIVYCIVLASVLLLFQHRIIGLFNPTTDTIQVIKTYLNISAPLYWFNGLLMLCTAFLYVMKKPFVATMLLLIHVFVLYIPLAYVFDIFWQWKGLIWAIPVSFVIAGSISMGVLYRKISKT